MKYLMRHRIRAWLTGNRFFETKTPKWKNFTMKK